MTRNELTKLWAKVTGKFNALIDGAPEALNTLKKIADKLGDNDDALAGLLTQVGSKQDALMSGQNIKSINGQSVLGEGNLELGELFVVTMTRHNSIYTADKSVSEIYAASYTNGKPVIAVMRDINTPILILTDCDPDADSYVFSAIESNVVTTLIWKRTDDYTYELETMVLQPHLVSGTSIKTVNNESLLGGGNVDIVGKSAYQSYVDTTADSPVKTEAEWVASLKGEDGVSLGEVAVADNLTTDDGTKVLSARQGYNLGQKVNDVDAEPTAGSEKFVKSGGVQNELALGAVYDVSVKNPTAGQNNDGKFESLSALLSDANLNNLIPTSVRKGGMSIKFVQSSDNKYVRYNLLADSFTTDTTQWAIDDGGIYVENPEFVEVKTDSEGKILWAIEKNGNIHFGAGVPQQVIDYINEKIAELSLDEYEDIVSFLSDYLGSDTTLKVMIDGINARITTKLDAEGLDSSALETQQSLYNQEYIEATTDSEGRILAGRTPDGAAFENVGFSTPKTSIDGTIIENIEDPEGRIEVTTDSEEKVVSYRDSDGILHEKVGIITKTLKFGNNDNLNNFRNTILPSCTTVKEAVDKEMTGLIQVGENVVVGLNSLNGEYTVADIEKNYRNILPNPKFPFIKKVSLHRLYDDAETPNMLYMCSQSDSHIFYSICPTDTKRAFGTVDPNYYTKYEANYFYYANKQNPSELHKVVLPLTVDGVSMNKRIKFVFEMSNGDCLLEIENGDAVPGMSVASYNNIYKVSNVFSDTSLVESDFSKVLTFDYWLSKISSFDNIVEGKPGYIVLAPYSGGRSGKVYLSKDYGSTWDLIFCADTNNETHYIKPKAEHFGESDAYGVYPTPELMNPGGELDWSATGNTNVHIHGIAYDRWYDRIWIVTGDGGAQQDHNVTGIWWTDDEGYTWKRIGGGKEIGTQLIGVIPMGHCVLFPTDGGGNGFWRWSRNGKDSIIDIEHCYNYAGVSGLVVYGGRTVRAKNGFYLTTIAPENYGNPNWSNLGGVVASYSGFDFDKIYEDTFGEGTYETAEIGCCCAIADCGNKIILGAYKGGYIELNY